MIARKVLVPLGTLYLNYIANQIDLDDVMARLVTSPRHKQGFLERASYASKRLAAHKVINTVTVAVRPMINMQIASKLVQLSGVERLCAKTLSKYFGSPSPV